MAGLFATPGMVAAVAILAVLLSSPTARASPPSQAHPDGAPDATALLWLALLRARAAPPMTQQQAETALEQYYEHGAEAASVPSSGPAARYFTDGAAVTSVPTSGPEADYFTHGADVLSAPSSAIPEPAFEVGAPP